MFLWVSQYVFLLIFFFPICICPDIAYLPFTDYTSLDKFLNFSIVSRQQR